MSRFAPGRSPPTKKSCGSGSPSGWTTATARHAADRRLTFVDHNGVPFIDLKVPPRRTGHPPQQCWYRPAVDQVLRDGVDRFARVDVLLEHECLRVHPERTASN